MEEIEFIEKMIKEYKTFGDLDNPEFENTEKIYQVLENILKRYKEAYAKANNYLYFNDSADYEVALWEVIRSLRPDLAEKWDNGEDANLKYIKEEF